MAATLLKNGNFYITRTEEYWIDDRTDLEQIPKEAPAFSYAVNPKTGEVFYKNTAGEWIEFGGQMAASVEMLSE